MFIIINHVIIKKRYLPRGDHLLDNLKRIIVVVGHYGSGKTNLSVNLALHLNAIGKKVVLVDLDTVNPYFRSADFADLMEQHDIELISPVYARTNLDIPALTGRLDTEINTDKTLIIDVGGDDAGAAALGRYSTSIREAGGCEMLYVVNAYRYLTRTADEAAQILGEVQRASRLFVTGVVNNSNLAELTTAEDVAAKDSFARDTAAKYKVPLLFTSVEERIASETNALLPNGTIFPVKIFVKKPWEE